jgi:hypothetical protein
MRSKAIELPFLDVQNIVDPRYTNITLLLFNKSSGNTCLGNNKEITERCLRFGLGSKSGIVEERHELARGRK